MVTTVGKLAVICANNDATSRIVGLGDDIMPSQASFSLSAFSVVRYAHITMESNTYLKYVILCEGMNTDSPGWTTNPSESNSCRVSITFLTQSS